MLKVPFEAGIDINTVVMQGDMTSWRSWVGKPELPTMAVACIKNFVNLERAKNESKKKI
jgi:hypothetical protein